MFGQQMILALVPAVCSHAWESRLPTAGYLGGAWLCPSARKEGVVAVQSQVVSDSVTPWTAAHQASLSFHLPEFAQTHVLSVSDVIRLILCCPLCLLPLIFPSIRVFSNELALCIR